MQKKFGDVEVKKELSGTEKQFRVDKKTSGTKIPQKRKHTLFFFSKMKQKYRTITSCHECCERNDTPNLYDKKELILAL